MKNIYSFIICCIFISEISSAQTFSWVNPAGNGTYVDYGFGVAVDNQHNVVATGMHFNNATFNSTIVNGYGYQDAYIAKYDSTGNLLWVHGIGGGEQDWGYAIAVDANDNIFITGTYAWYAIHFTATDSLPISAPQATNCFIAKYDANGNFLWARSGGCSYGKSSSVEVDTSGNAIISGFFNSTINFSGNILNGGGQNLFFVKYDSIGNVTWAKAGISSSNCSTNALKCDAAGNIYATGKISQTITFASTPYLHNGGDDMYTAKFDAGGNLQWFKVQGNSLVASSTANTLDSGNGIDVDNSGNIYVAGSLLDTFIVSSMYQSLAVVKYDNNGNQQWLYKYGNNSIDVCNSLSLDAAGNPYVIGSYSGALTIGNSVLPTASDVDIFIAKFNSSGACIAAMGIGTGNGNDAGNGICVDKTSIGVAITGSMRNNLNFGSIPVSGDNASTIFVGKMFGDALSGIAENQLQNNFSLFPNPANGIINLQFENAGNYLVEIYNSFGQVVYSEKTNAQFNTIDTSDFANGFYFISTSDSNGNRTTKKIIKE
ncbi:hypothetical protein BH09BAC5_BH09BAC5_12060 [soil metagenome]